MKYYHLSNSEFFFKEAWGTWQDLLCPYKPTEGIGPKFSILTTFLHLVAKLGSKEHPI